MCSTQLMLQIVHGHFNMDILNMDTQFLGLVKTSSFTFDKSTVNKRDV